MGEKDSDSERILEQAAMFLFKELGYTIVDCMNEIFGPGGTLGRETRADVVLLSRLRPMLEALNPDLPDEALTQGIEEITRDRSAMTPARANQDVHCLLKDGVTVRFRDADYVDRVETVRVIDWENPYNNDFLLTSQLWVTGEMYTRRADLVGFVNGVPLLFIELKAHHKRLRDAYDNNLRDYRDTIPHLFWHNGIIILSNGSLARIGSTTAGWEHFVEWKKITSEGEEGVISLETVIRGTCEPARLLDIVENFTVFSEEPGGLVKMVAKNHQYLGVNNAIEAVGQIRGKHGQLGVFWHTQGAGKSLSMIFFSQKVLRTLAGNWTFVVVTDRTELDDQIYRRFARAGVVTEEHVQAESSAHLRKLLREDHRYVFTLIQKFRTPPGERHPVLSKRDDIVVIADEAHRSQYDIFAGNMGVALPNAAFIGFTGTPLIVGEEKTRDTFGDYVSVYNFRESVEDSVTVPLWYENRIPQLQLTNEELNTEMEELLDEAMLTTEEEARLEREFTRQYEIITRDDRLEAIAEDIVEHFMGRGFLGKAMVVSIDRTTAVRMYDKVQRYWRAYIERLRDEAATSDDPEWREALERRVAFMEETDMAVVISQSQNEVADFRVKGLDIRPHRRRMVNEALDEKFKDPDDPFRIVFVCAMWMTGFDAHACSTIYLDKPMRNHTLMQTIARANRVFGEKPSGQIVDYVGVFRDLQRALAIYGSASGGGVEPGDVPVRPKEELIAMLRGAIGEASAFCADLGIDFSELQAEEGFDRIAAFDDAVELILVDEETKNHYLALARRVDTLYRAILPDRAAGEFGPTASVLRVLAGKIRSLDPKVDVADVMEEVGGILDESVAAERYAIRTSEVSPLIDLSRIDFDVLRERFGQTGHKRTITERLKSSITRKLEEMIRLNRTRMDYQKAFQRMIDEYNEGATNIDVLFENLIAFARSLDEEERRSIAEQLTEEELAIFDLLTRPSMNLTEEEEGQVKEVARDLLDTLKAERLVLDWRKRQQARAAVRLAIEEVLDRLPPTYDAEAYQRKCDLVYQHVYDSYYGPGRSVYAGAN
jgi:type I restriction enzyme R subunit